MRSFDVAVLGSGPVGLVAALRIARQGRSVIVATDHAPQREDARRVDAAPAEFAALLAELGIHPATVGIDRLHRVRHCAWENAAPCAFANRNSVHLERPALDLALFAALRRTDGTAIELGKLPLGNPLAGKNWRARRVVDATGRAAVTARSRTHPAHPWVARTFWTHRAACEATEEFSIAAMPDGYAYRLGTASIMTFGLVGRGAIIAGSAASIELRVRAFAPWLLDGVPALAAMSAGSTKPASVQWSEGDAGLRIGDAALARDALSSQGIATGASEAIFAAAVGQEGDVELVRLRQQEQRQAHLQSLLRIVDRCLYAHFPLWRDYRAFIASQSEAEPRVHSAAVRNERIQRVLTHSRLT